MTGLFRDPLLDRYPVESEDADAAYLNQQATYFALHALDSLGQRPRARLAFLDRLSAPEEVVAWLEGLQWSNPWLESNRVMFLLSFLIHRVEEERDPTAARSVHGVLDWLDAEQDPQTGLWGSQHGASLLNAMAGAFHFIAFYEYVHRPVRHVTRIIDSVLPARRTPCHVPWPGPLCRLARR